MPRPNLSLEIAAGVAERSARGTQEFLELYRRASPQQIQIVRYLMRLLHERQQAPSQRVDAEIKKLWKAIDSGRLGEIDLPRLH